MKKLIFNFIAAALSVALFAGCASQDNAQSRTNPYDPGGTDWKKNSNPRVAITLDSLPLWYDFDHSTSTGTIEGAVHAFDNNGSYDSVKVKIWIGSSVEKIDSPVIPVDSLLYLSGLLPGTRYYIKVSATDTWDSTTTVTGLFTTPVGVPPVLAEPYSASSSASYITVTWSTPAPSIEYKLFRSKYPDSGFTGILNTVSSTVTAMSYLDRVTEYRDYYYRISAVNQYGECKSKKPIWGYLYSTSVYAPSSISVTGYNNYLYLSWSSSSSYPRFFIHRSTSANGPFVVIDSTVSTYYHDTLSGADTAFYYCISARNYSGQRSAPSSYKYGALALLPGPSSVSASDGTYRSYINVSWSYVTGASGYYVYRSSSAYGVYAQIGQSSTTNYKDSVTTGETYYYKAAGFDSRGRTGNLSSYYDFGYLTLLSYPNPVTASTAYPNRILISWTGVTTAVGYYIYRAKNTSAADSLKLIDSTANFSYSDSVKTGDNYYYALVAYDIDGRKSMKSPVVYGYLLRPAASQMLSATANLFTGITITWQPVTGVKGYYVYRSESSGGSLTLVDSTDKTVYSDTTAKPVVSTMLGRYYYYSIAAYTATGIKGPLCSTISGYVKGLAAPAQLVINNFQYKNKLSMTWEKVPLATAYSVYRGSLASGSYLKIATVTDTSYIDNNLDPLSTSYYYKISSIGNGSEIMQTSYTRGYTLSAPANFKADLNAGFQWLNWTSIADTNVRGFILQRSADSIHFVTISLAPPSVTTYQDTVMESDRYFYRIYAYSRFDTSFASTIYSKCIPTVPGNVTAQRSADTGIVTWDSVPYARIYKINVSISLDGITSTTVLTRDAKLPRRYTITGAPGMLFTFKVLSMNKTGDSSNYSPAVTVKIPTLPGAPVAFSALGQSYGIALEWKSSASDIIDGYLLYRSADGGKTYALLDTVKGTSFKDSVANAVIYYYMVSAFNSSGEGPKSDLAMAQRLNPAPPSLFAPEGFFLPAPLPWAMAVSSGLASAEPNGIAFEYALSCKVDRASDAAGLLTRRNI